MIHHVGIVGQRYANQLLILMRKFGKDKLNLLDTKTIVEWQCECRMYRYGEGSLFELVTPTGGKLLEWANEHGPNSLHHFAVEVEDIRETCRLLTQQGVRLVSDHPVAGVCNTLVNFVHPSYCGVMLELVEILK